MEFLKLGLAFVAMMAVTVGAPFLATAQDKTPVAYFLEQMPSGTDAPDRLPSNAKDVVVAKVRLREGAFWLGGRHGEGTLRTSRQAQRRATGSV
jgi:lipid-binding SYLF domain-containing protein